MSDLAAALADVRRAYRLAHAYQRRVNDLLALVVDGLREVGLDYEGWYVVGRQMAPRRKTAFFTDKWAWDMLPGASIGVHLTATSTDQSLVVVHVQVIADTGYDEYEGPGEPDAATFPSEVECRSEVRWSMLRRPPGTDDGAMREALCLAFGDDRHDGTLRRMSVPEGTVVYQYRTLDLADLPSANAVRDLLLEPMRGAVAASSAGSRP